MRKTTITLCCAAIALTTLSSCRKDAEKAPAAENAPAITTATETIKWEVLPVLPHGVKECTCTLSENETAFSDKQYVYGDNVTAAFVQLDGKRRRLVSVKTEELSENHTIKTFHDGFYWMTVDMQQEPQTVESQELFKETAVIKITAKDGRSITKKVVGECGC